MATENVTILRVDTGEAVKSVNDLRQNIKILKDQLGDLDVTSEEYKKTLEDITKNQEALRTAMRGEKADISELTKLTRQDIDANTGLAKTYNGLVEQMSRLRRQQRDINISTVEGQAEFDKLASEINKVNSRLKELDAANGNYQRNVGNYTSGQVEVVDNFKKLREEIKHYRSELLGLDEGTEEYNLTMQKLADAQFKLRDANETARWSANDLGEQLSTMSRVTNGLVGGFTAAQSAMALLGGDTEKLEQAFYKVQAAMSVVQGLQGLEGLTKDLPIMVRQFKAATSGLTAFTAGLSGLQKALLATGIGALVAALGLLIANWDKVVNLVNKNTDETASYTAAVDDLLGSMDSLNKELDLNIQLMDAEGASQEEILNKRREATRQQLEEVQALKDSLSEKSKLNDGEREQLDRLIVKENELYDVLEQLNTQALVTEVRAQKKKQDEEEEIQRKMRLIEANQQLASLEVEVPQEDIEAPLQDFSELTKNPQANTMNAVQNGMLEEIDAETQHKLNMNQILTQDAAEQAEAQYQIQLEADQRKLELMRQFEEEAYKVQDLEGALEWQQEAADLEVKIYEDKVREEVRLEQEAAEKKAKQQQKVMTIMQASASGVSSLLTSMADMYEANAGDSADAAEKTKGIRIAAATIDTITGAIGAYMQASATIPPPGGQIVGAIQAAAVIAAGIAQIAQIKNTQIPDSSGSSSSSSRTSSITVPSVPSVPDVSSTVSSSIDQYESSMPAIVSAPLLDPEINTVRNITTASEEERLNQMASSQRVYILSSDIEASQNARRVRVQESSF